jgi:hypothetical protein
MYLGRSSLLVVAYALSAAACSSSGTTTASGSTGTGTGGAAGGGTTGAFATSSTATGSSSTSASGSTGSGQPCPDDQKLCNGQCTATIVDPNNCGNCGVKCMAGQVCVSNGCTSTCPSPLVPCNGTCVDTQTDSANCNGCGNVCAPGKGCSNGACSTAVVVGPPPAKCVNGGPPIVIQGGPTPTCTGVIAGVFSYALCTCQDIGVPALSANSFFDGFNSAVGPYVPNGLGGSVGANGSINMTAQFHVYGDVRTSSGPGLQVGGQTDVHQQLEVATNLKLQNPLTVTKDAIVGGTISGNASATIGGTLHTPSCAAVPANVTDASCMNATPTVPPSCDCAANHLIPVDAIVAHYADPANNDNALIGLAANTFDSPGAPNVLDLPCGYYYLDRIDATTPVTIAVHGHTALFIGGSVEVSSPVAFALDAKSTLDVFVGGTMYATAAYSVGSPAYPAKSRFYVGGICKASGSACTLNADCCSLGCNNGTCTGGGANLPPFSVDLSANTHLNGGFYSPFGMFETSAQIEMYGAIFANYYKASAETKIHYDAAFLSQGKDCPNPGGCNSCTDCGNQACINGTCGSCLTSADCCQPLYCNMGMCVPQTPM